MSMEMSSNTWTLSTNQYISQLANKHDPKFLSASEPPSPAFNFYNGGSRPRNTLDHFVFLPHEAMPFYEAIKMDERFYDRFMQSIKEGLDLLRSAISELKYKNEISEVESKMVEKISRFILSHVGWIYDYWYKIDIETTSGRSREFAQKIKSGMILKEDLTKSYKNKLYMQTGYEGFCPAD